MAQLGLFYVVSGGFAFLDASNSIHNSYYNAIVTAIGFVENANE